MLVLTYTDGSIAVIHTRQPQPPLTTDEILKKLDELEASDIPRPRSHATAQRGIRRKPATKKDAHEKMIARARRRGIQGGG